MIKKLESRVSPKKFDESKVSLEDMYDLVKACNMAPTSFGIQPVRLSIVTSANAKSQLQPATYYQPQVMSCSNILVFSVLDIRKDSYIESYASFMQSVTRESDESINRYKASLTKFMHYMTDELYLQWASKQAYLTLGILIAACAEKDIDCCPIEGFQESEYGEMLGLTEDGYTPVIICAIGKASVEDPRAMIPKIRIPNSDYVLGEH